MELATGLTFGIHTGLFTAKCVDCDSSCSTCDMTASSANSCLSCPDGTYLEILDSNRQSGQCISKISSHINGMIEIDIYVTGMHDGIAIETGDLDYPFSSILRAFKYAESEMAQYEISNDLS